MNINITAGLIALTLPVQTLSLITVVGGLFALLMMGHDDSEQSIFLRRVTAIAIIVAIPTGLIATFFEGALRVPAK